MTAEKITKELKRIFNDERWSDSLEGNKGTYDVPLNDEGFGMIHEECCDCGLVHYVVYEAKKNKLIVHKERDDDFTWVGREVKKLLRKIGISE